jgi:hypothetical protein
MIRLQKLTLHDVQQVHLPIDVHVLTLPHPLNDVAGQFLMADRVFEQLLVLTIVRLFEVVFQVVVGLQSPR